MTLNAYRNLEITTHNALPCHLPNATTLLCRSMGPSQGSCYSYTRPSN